MPIATLRFMGAASAFISAISPSCTTGRCARLFWGGAVVIGLIGGSFARAFASGPGRYRRPATMAGSVCTVAGGLALKWAVVYAGRESARDPAAARSAARATTAAPGWAPAP